MIETVGLFAANFFQIFKQLNGTKKAALMNQMKLSASARQNQSQRRWLDE